MAADASVQTPIVQLKLKCLQQYAIIAVCIVRQIVLDCFPDVVAHIQRGNLSDSDSDSDSDEDF